MLAMGKLVGRMAFNCSLLGFDSSLILTQLHVKLVAGGFQLLLGKPLLREEQGTSHMAVVSSCLTIVTTTRRSSLDQNGGSKGNTR